MTTNEEKLTDKYESLKRFLHDEMRRISATLTAVASGDFLDAVEAFEKERNSFLEKYRRIPLGSESFLTVLRRWNSYTPSLPTSTETDNKLTQYSIGGGYFLFIEAPEESTDSGYGLVIDPGYNFVHNYGSAGFALDDIDGILMTHAHNDHTNDFESLLALLFQRNDRHRGSRSAKKVDLYLNVGAFKKFSNYLDLARVDEKNYIGKVVVMSPGQCHKIPSRKDLECEILTLYTNHHEIVTADYALGLCFKIAGRNLLFTGDTGWTLETAKKNEDFLKEHDVHTREEAESGNIDILVAHIGTVTRDEFEKDKLYNKHLGACGVISTVEQWKPTVCIISEFGEELTHIRAALVKEIEISCKKLYPDVSCIAGDVGLFVCLEPFSCLCYATGKLVNIDEIKYEELDTDGVKTIKYYSEKGIQNLAEAARKDLINKTLTMRNGLTLYRRAHLEKVVADFRLESTDRNTLMSNLCNFRWDPFDVLTTTESNETPRGILYALSCLVERPEELFDILRLNPGVLAGASVWKAYHLPSDAISLFDDLAMAWYAAGFCDIAPSSVDSFLLKHFKFYPQEILTSYLEKNVSKCQDMVCCLKKCHLDDVWKELSEEEKCIAFIEAPKDANKLPLTEIENHTLSCLTNYLSRLDATTGELYSLMDACAPNQCHMGAYRPDVAQIKSTLERIIASPESEKIRADIERMIFLCDVLLAFNNEVALLLATLVERLHANGHEIDTDKGIKHTLVMANYYGRKLVAEKIPDTSLAAAISELDNYLLSNK